MVFHRCLENYDQPEREKWRKIELFIATFKQAAHISFVVACGLFAFPSRRVDLSLTSWIWGPWFQTLHQTTSVSVLSTVVDRTKVPKCNSRSVNWRRFDGTYLLYKKSEERILWWKHSHPMMFYTVTHTTVSTVQVFSFTAALLCCSSDTMRSTLVYRKNKKKANSARKDSFCEPGPVRFRNVVCR